MEPGSHIFYISTDYTTKIQQGWNQGDIFYVSTDNTTKTKQGWNQGATYSI